MSRILVFAGPTLSAEDITALVPLAEVRPPIAAGDLLQMDLERGDLAAIIDGFYFQSSPVRHKEILALLDAGVQVWGAASMGAMRAAELAPFGMRGFGQIFQAYLDGSIEGDDEVAVLHAEEDMQYLHLSEALVNIRHACRQALAVGILSQEEHDLLVEIGRSLPFFERSYPQILTLAVEHGLSEQRANAFRHFVQEQSSNLKRDDALELLRALQTWPGETAHLSKTFPLHETTYLRNWKIFGRGTRIAADLSVSDAELLNASLLFGADYPRLRARVLLQVLADTARWTFAAEAQDSQPPVAPISPEGDEAQIITTRPEDNEVRANTELVARYIARQCHLSLDEAQELPEVLRKWLRASERALPRARQLELLALRIWQEPRSLSWHKILIEHLRNSPVYPTLLKTVVQARAFNQALQEQVQELELQRLPSAQIYAWFLQRWNVSADDASIALLERGLQSQNDLVETARPFYLLDRYSGVAPFALEEQPAGRNATPVA